jgi:colicin import membrane protein
MNEIVKINASDYGLEESKASEIEAMFLPMLAKMRELEKEFNHILKLPIDPETCQMAHDLRQSYVKVRTGTEKIHKDLKAFYLNGGRFVDAFKNTQAFASGEKETTLKAIEDHFENQERERLEKLRTTRLELLKPYTEIEPLALGHMEQTVFDNLLTGFKTAYEVRIAAEKKAEEERIAKEKAEAEERERQRLENIRLKKEAEEREKELQVERAKAESERKALEEKARKEREEREKLETEIKAKKVAEELAQKQAQDKAIKEERERIAAIKAAEKAPDKEKLNKWIDEVFIGLTPNVGGEAHKVAIQIQDKFSGFKKWAKEQIELL